MEPNNTGLPEFKIANRFQDVEMLKSVQRLAIKIMQDDPTLENEKNEKLKKQIQFKFSEKIEI